jgi:hypothetical protein
MLTLKEENESYASEGDEKDEDVFSEQSGAYHEQQNLQRNNIAP